MNYLSLFSGIGGFEHGIEQSQFSDELNCIGFGEIDKYAKNIYKKHYPNHPDLGDVTKIRTEDLPEFDLLVGGFPCQAFSVAGKRRGFNDTRGTLFFEIARILKDKKPKYFLLENVKGLLSHDKGRTFQTILRTLSELGYDVQWEIFNSKNHGVPQNRERIYIKGFLRERCGSEVLSLRKTGTETDTQQEETGKHIKLHSSLGYQGSEIYNPEGISPTLLCSHAGSTKIVENKETQIVRLNEKPENERDHEGNRLYSECGVSPTLTVSTAGQIKVGCVDGNDLMFPSTRDGNFFAVTTHHRGTPFSKKQDNYVLEKDETSFEIEELYTSTQKNGRKQDTTTSPTLTASMGKGGGHVPMIKCVGNIYPSGGQNGTVYDENGLVGTLGLSSGGTGGEGKKVLIHDDTESPKINKIGNINPNGKSQSGNVYGADGLSPTLNCTDYKAPTKILLKNNTKKGYAEAEDGDGIVYGQFNGRGRVQKQKVPTLNTSGGCGAGVVIKDNTKEGSHVLHEGDGLDIANTNPSGRKVRDQHVPTLNTKSGGGSATYDGYSIRKLTPVETEKLQGFPKNWTKEGADGSQISDTQRYKCCGNAVTTNVVRDIINTWNMKFDD